MREAAGIHGDVASIPNDVIADFHRKNSGFTTIDEYKTTVKVAIEGWPQAVRDLSFTSAGFRLTADERDWLAEIAATCSPGAGITEHMALEHFEMLRAEAMFSQIAAKCDEQIAKFDTAPFFKFGTRAPKDSPMFAEFEGRVPNGLCALLNIATSWRAFEDMAQSECHATDSKNRLTMAANIFGGQFLKLLGRSQPETVDHLPWMWFREYQKWEPWQEYRCFMKDRRYMGATQYHGVDPNAGPLVAYQDILERGYDYEAAIKIFFDEKFAPATNGWIQGCVFDVAVDLDAEGGPRVALIEINPAHPRTFPGLKDWANMASFDGELSWLSDTTPRVLVDPNTKKIRYAGGAGPVPDDVAAAIAAWNDL